MWNEESRPSRCSSQQSCSSAAATRPENWFWPILTSINERGGSEQHVVAKHEHPKYHTATSHKNDRIGPLPKSQLPPSKPGEAMLLTNVAVIAPRDEPFEIRRPL